MNRIARFIVSRSRLIIAATMALNVLALVSFGRASFDASIFSVLRTEEPYAKQFLSLAEKYGGTDTVMIVLSSDEPLTTVENLTAVWEYVERLRDVGGLAGLSSFLPPVVPGGRLFEPVTRETITENHAALISMLEREGGMFSNLLSENRRIGAVQISIGREAEPFAVLEALRSVPRPQGMDVSFAGSQVIFETLWNTITRVIFIFPPITFFFLLAIFYANVRSGKLTLLALLPAAFGALWMLQTIFWAGLPLGIVLVISPIFVLVMGSADGLHFVIHYLQNAERSATEAPKDRVALTERTLREVGIPIILTTVTTMVGFLSLSFSGIRSLRQLGIFSSVGIAYAGVISLFFLPAVLARVRLGRTGGKRTLSAAVLRILVPLARRPLVPILVMAALVIGSLLAIPRLKVYSNQLLFFRKSSELRKTFELVERELGSSQPIIGEFALEGAQGLTDAGALERIDRLEREMEELPGIHRVSSLADMLTFLYKIRMGRPGLPPSPVVRLMLELVPEAGSFASEDGLLFYAFTRDWDTAAASRLLEFTEAHPELRIVTGMPILFTRLNQLVVDTQRSSLLITACGVLLLLLAIFRNVKAALVAVLPIAVTVTGIYGLLYVSGFHLNIMNATVSSIAIGVGIDYAIHLIFSIRYHRQEGERQYAVRAVQRTGIPILANAMGIGIGILSLLFSPLYLHVQAAAVISFSMLVSSAGALVLIPAFYPKGLGYTGARELFLRGPGSRRG